MQLTQAQKDLLVLLGSPDDGTQDWPPVSMETLRELIALGLVEYTGKNTNGNEVYDLTNAGEQEYGRLTGEDMR